MPELIPPEADAAEEAEASVASRREDARKHVREQLAAGAPEVDIAEYIGSLEPLPADAVSDDEGKP